MTTLDAASQIVQAVPPLPDGRGTVPVAAVSYSCGMNRPQEPLGTPRRPIAMGCALAAMVVAGLVVFVVFATLFFESGAETGKIRLEVAESYALGSIEFVAPRNFYLVRISPREFIALSDLDAANRANPQRRCRVSPIPRDDPGLTALLERFAAATNPAASGSTLIFRETCNGALYDVTGLRLNGPGSNLDRYPVAIDSAGRVTVDVSKRRCSERVEQELFAEIDCPR